MGPVVHIKGFQCGLLYYTEVIMKTIIFQEKFEEVLKEESKGFDIDWQLVDIEAIHYHFTRLTDLPMTLDEYVVRMRVVEDEIPDMDNVDDWFKSHKFIYAIMLKNVRADSEETDRLTLELGTIESIALKTRKAFRYFYGR